MAIMENTRGDLSQVYRSNSIAVMVEGALFSLIRLSISPYLVLPYYLGKLTDSAFLIGLIPAVFVIGFALPQVLMARIIERSQNKMRLLILSALAQRICIFGMLVLTIAQRQLSNTATIYLFFVLYFLFNMARGCYSPSYVDFLGRGVPKHRGKILGAGNFVGGILNLFGTLLLTRLLTDLPYPQAITAIMAVSLIGSLISFGAILFLKDIYPSEKEKAKISAIPDTRKISLSKDFQGYLVWRSVIIGLEMMLSFYTLYGLEKFDLPASFVGIYATMLTVADALGNPFWGWLGDKIGYLRVIIVSTLLGGIGALVAALSTDQWVFSLVFILNGLMLSGQSLGGINIIYEYARTREVPTYVAYQQVMMSALSGLAPVLGASLTAVLGYSLSSLIAGLWGLAGVLGMEFFVDSPRLDIRT